MSYVLRYISSGNAGNYQVMKNDELPRKGIMLNMGDGHHKLCVCSVKIS